MRLFDTIYCERVGIATRNNRLPIPVGSPFTSNNLYRRYQDVTQKNKTFYPDLPRTIRFSGMEGHALVLKIGLSADKAELQSQYGEGDNGHIHADQRRDDTKDVLKGDKGTRCRGADNERTERWPLQEEEYLCPVGAVEMETTTSYGRYTKRTPREVSERRKQRNTIPSGKCKANKREHTATLRESSRFPKGS